MPRRRQILAGLAAAPLLGLRAQDSTRPARFRRFRRSGQSAQPHRHLVVFVLGFPPRGLAGPQCIEAAARMGFDGVELLQRQLTTTAPPTSRSSSATRSVPGST